MISYSLDVPPRDGHYVVSYSSLREDYWRYSKMSDEEFKKSLLQALHFACVTCWFKEKQTQYVLSDTGVIHELVHLLVGFYDDNDEQFQQIRKLFNEECELV